MHQDDSFSDEQIENPILSFTLDDFMNNPETFAILEDEYYDKFHVKMRDKVESFYKSHVFDSVDNFLDIFDKDFFGKNSSDLFFIIYSYIHKKYDISIFHDKPTLANSMFKDNDNTIKKTIPKIINSKIIDWDLNTILEDKVKEAKGKEDKVKEVKEDKVKEE